MTYREIYESALWDLRHSNITVGEFDERVKPLNQEVKKTGHWILDETDNSITCDQCGCLIWANDIINGDAYYCPNCGANMKGENK